MMFPRVTVVISAFNSDKWLRACIGQLQGQSIVDALEVIVIDSGSEQDERSVCREFSALLPGLIYERTERETLYAAWNRALAKASGKYFVNANTDDSLHPEALRLLSETMEAHPDAALAYGDWMCATVPNAPYPWDSRFRRCVHSEYHPTLPLFYAYAGCHQFWRTDKLRELGGFDGSYQAAGDYDALCRMALKRWHAAYIPERISAFYQNPDGLSRSSVTSHREFLGIRERFRSQVAIDDLYDVDPTDGAASARAWIDLAHRALSLRVPWAEEAAPDAEFAVQCVRKALDLDPANQEAKDLLASSTKGWRELIRRTWRSSKSIFSTQTKVEHPAAPKARTPSPRLATKEEAST
jgi:glycosyltransferase involved in cell wall biosynthesis